MKKEINVVGAAIFYEGNIYICRRSPEMSLANYWEFPGGKIEDGETMEDALVREIKEELSCEIIVNEFVNTMKYDYGKFIVNLSVYECALKNEKPIINEHSEEEWVSTDELSKYDFAPADIPAVKLLEEKYGK